MSYELMVREHPDGSIELAADAPARIHITQELLDCARPEVLKVGPNGDVLFTLTNAVLWYRRIGPVGGDPRMVEFERVA